MKATINRIVYNTDKATLVAEDGSMEGGFHAWNETLHVTPNGTWFLHGWGGAMTDYADHEYGRSSEGERIIPMTREEALTWCEEHKAQDAIDSHFSDMVSEA